MKLAICNETYEDWSFDDVCRDVAAAGYDGIEVALNVIAEDPSRLTIADARDLGATATRHGLDVVGLHWLLKAPAGMHVSTPEMATRDRTVAFLEHLAALCGAMGGAVMVLGSPKQRDVLPGDTYDDAFDRAVDSCRRVAVAAAAAGVILALEPLGSAYTNFLTTAAEAVRVIEAVDHPACRLHLDVFAMSTEARPIPEILRSSDAHLVHVHVNDTSMGGPGTGDVDYPEVINALRDIEYDGYLSVEVFDMSGGGPRIARASREFLTALL